MLSVRLGWKKRLHAQIKLPYFKDLAAHVRKADREGAVYPPPSQRLKAFDLAPEEVRVVILGQDPYHGPGQAMGLSFSVPQGVRPPPSLVNMFKEIEAEGGAPAAGRSGDLTPWQTQGVMLLNAALTVTHQSPGSHKDYGWHTFTDAVIQSLSDEGRPRAFLLWGKFAQEKQILIDSGKNLVLCSSHPSPFSAYRGFMGNGHFKAVNQWLEKRHETPIQW